MMNLQDAIAHMTQYAEGLEIAADCERRIEAAYAPELALWEERDSGPPNDLLNRKMRNLLDARASAKRISRDAEALRIILLRVIGDNPV